MQLPPIVDFFNFSNLPWPVVERPSVFGEWAPPGRAFSSCVANIVFNPPDSIKRPHYLIMQTCQQVIGGSADFLLYASDSGEYGNGFYPWRMKSFLPLVIAHCPETGPDDIRHLWDEKCQKKQIDALVAMKTQSGIRFGVACKHTPGAKVFWHSAKMLSWTP